VKKVLVGLILAAATVGCGGGSKEIKPLTEEEKAAIKAHDKAVEDEEHAGSGKSLSTRKK
jgi:hypothetical protein